MNLFIFLRIESINQGVAVGRAISMQGRRRGGEEGRGRGVGEAGRSCHLSAVRTFLLVARLKSPLLSHHVLHRTSIPVQPALHLLHLLHIPPGWEAHVKGEETCGVEGVRNEVQGAHEPRLPQVPLCITLLLAKIWALAKWYFAYQPHLSISGWDHHRPSNMAAKDTELSFSLSFGDFSWWFTHCLCNMRENKWIKYSAADPPP